MSLRAQALQALRDAQAYAQGKRVKDLMDALNLVGINNSEVEIIDQGRFRAQVGDITAFHLYWDEQMQQLCVCNPNGALRYETSPLVINTLADLGQMIDLYEHNPI